MALTRQITALFLALLTIISASTFSMGFHFCGGSIESISVFSPGEPCQAKLNLPPCHRQMTPSCCEDHSVVHDGDEFNSSTLSHFDATNNFTLIQPILIELYSIVMKQSAVAHFLNNDDGPPIILDRTITFRSFLI